MADRTVVRSGRWLRLLVLELRRDGNAAGHLVVGDEYNGFRLCAHFDYPRSSTVDRIAEGAVDCVLDWVEGCNVAGEQVVEVQSMCFAHPSFALDGCCSATAVRAVGAAF